MIESLHSVVHAWVAWRLHFLVLFLFPSPSLDLLSHHLVPGFGMLHLILDFCEVISSTICCSCCRTGVKSSLNRSSSERMRIDSSTGSMSSKRSSCAALVCANMSAVVTSGGGALKSGANVVAAADKDDDGASVGVYSISACLLRCTLARQRLTCSASAGGSAHLDCSMINNRSQADTYEYETLRGRLETM